MDGQIDGHTDRWMNKWTDMVWPSSCIALWQGQLPPNQSLLLPVLLVEDSMAVFQKLLSKEEADSEARGVFQILDPEPSRAEQ